jgi:C-terminal processing protease CtpA/Prc
MQRWHCALAAPFTIMAAFATSACRDQQQATLQHRDAASTRIANLHAFARLYGVVRWFHPSDAAAAIDWDEMALDGVHRVADAEDCSALRTRLTELFAPVAPTMHIAAAGEAFPDEPALHPAPISGLDVVSWQHSGYGDSTLPGDGYASKRRHRARSVRIPGGTFLALSQSVDATAYRSMPIRLRGKLRAASRARAQIWLRIDRGETTIFLDNMDDRPVTSRTWTEAEVVGAVSSDATQIVFGVLAQNALATWYDDLELSVRAADGTWQRTDVPGGDFEGSTSLEHWHPGIGRAGRSASSEGWDVTLDRDQPGSGASSLRVEAATKQQTDELFAEAPRPGETVDLDLGCALRARVPIALYSRAGHTLGDSRAGHTLGDGAEQARRAETVSHPATRPAASHRAIIPANFDALASAADVIVVWNALRHFWPYWNLISVNWNAELDTALADALHNRSIGDRAATIQRLSVAAPDGHARTGCPGEQRRVRPPFALDEVEDRVVVTSTADPRLVPGDVIVAIDGKPVARLLASEESQISGSPQWRRSSAVRRLGRGSAGSSIRLTLHRGTADLDVSVPRSEQVVLPPPAHAAIERLDDGTYYVDLSRASIAAIEAVMNQLAAAPGVVFDVRGYPNNNDQVLSHLLTVPDTSKWVALPRIVRPDSPASPAAWEWDGRYLPVLQPHIQGRVAFMTGPRAISYAESVMGQVEHYHLGEIVGAATAGTNGNIVQATTPTGCDFVFTGRLVTKLDGSRHYLRGIAPTIPAAPTIAGIAAGRDEVLERALAYVRGAAH